MTLDTVNQNVIGLVALLISLVALFTTTVQVLQQYFSSAEGYRRCADSVMGLWAKGTHRRLRWNEFRVEVIFETPVIFVAPPTNKRGPILNKPIHYIDGTSESYTKTRVAEPQEQEDPPTPEPPTPRTTGRLAFNHRGTRLRVFSQRGTGQLGEITPEITRQKTEKQESNQRVRTADDERASWVTLLSVLQLKERASRKWDEKQLLVKPPRVPVKKPAYELAVGLQAKGRSWDFVPASITRPYATTAICHLVEIAAMLGMYWKAFDQIQWNLRAEGNGFIVTSTMVHGLGVMITFGITGRSTFESNRPIPTEAIKELSFGVVPNIFEEDKYLRDNPDSQSVSLKFGNEEDVDSTLESLGCPHEILKRYKQDHKHIFSVSFELIGMLGKVFRQRGSSFRMIPNPTQDFWLKKVGVNPSWKITRLMEVFQNELNGLVIAERFDLTETTPGSIALVIQQWKKIEALMKASKQSKDECDLSIEVLEAIHNVLDENTKYFVSKEMGQQNLLTVVVAHLDAVTKVLDNANSRLNSIVSGNKEQPLMEFYFQTIRPAVTQKDSAGKVFPRDVEVQRTTIWVSLMFRMLCWLMLHDWARDDRCIVPTDLKGSRMPVFIG
ncbi:modin protein [Rutstroemia sp. NJR-2017a WRK4]|nr:modin protein [Rutstroemia sp. NJR-2017a WRK4]PQE14863.1 modin protein [Rutstroemia sp. NJR-2017a WRK4]